MCIIVAKPAGAKMPGKKIISNCFSNNPDGAGIMLCANGKVRGYKGLMTYESVINQLAKLEKKYGKLDNFNVVMHFRIGTHGANIAANTHPFPVTGTYKAMRKLEWIADLGMAHNGIISDVSSHKDIKKENVSDTMVFIRRVVNPIARATNIMKSPEILEALRLAAGSKLCFIDKDGNMEALGDFVFEDGVYYSNSTYSHERITYSWKNYMGGWTSSKGWTPAAYSYEYNYDDKEIVYLSKDDEDFLMQSLAEEYGMEILDEDDVIVYNNRFEQRVGKLNLAFSPMDYGIYEWLPGVNDWEIYLEADEYDHIIEAGVDANA